MTLSLPNTEGSHQCLGLGLPIDTACRQPHGSNRQTMDCPHSFHRQGDLSGNRILALNPHVSNNRLDNELRNSIAMNFNRRTAASTAGNTAYTGPTRTIEAIMTPQGGSTSIWGNGILLKNALTMSGSGTIDHFDSSKTSTTTFLTSPSVYRSTDYTETLIGMLNVNGSQSFKHLRLHGGVMLVHDRRSSTEH